MSSTADPQIAAAETPPAAPDPADANAADQTDPGTEAAAADPPAAAAPAASAPLPAAEDRAALAGRIRRSARLAPGLRERLSQAVAEGADQSADGQPALRAADVVALLEAALPAAWPLDAQSAETAAHPGGESFFTGEGELSDEQAEQTARRQLTRAGLLASV